MSNVDVVKASLEAYRTQDRATAVQLLGEDFVFTSPQDDHIEKATSMERCFPTADRFVSQELLEVVPAGDDGVFILYEYELETGDRHRMSFTSMKTERRSDSERVPPLNLRQRAEH